MTARISTLAIWLRQWRTRSDAGRVFLRDTPLDLPLRAELFSADQMELHGHTLAGQHTLYPRHCPDLLLGRLDDNASLLGSGYGLLNAAVKAKRRLTPAGEWLLDNAYLIEEHIRTARQHFPKGYSRELPVLASGASAGLPRVYDIALEAIAHGDGRLDPESLNRFVAAYQGIAELKLGELWAIPIMLRLALIENLRRVGVRVAQGMLHRNLADGWADQMIQTAESDPKSLILVIADMARANPPLVNSFVAALVRRLQGHSSALALPLTWIEQRLSECGQTIDQLVQSETQSQAANQVSISNSIGSLRLLAAIDWREFVENMSRVDQQLRQDPGGVYAQMDFATRDRYRHVVETLARRSPLSEAAIAGLAVELAQQGLNGALPRGGHVGFYLIDQGQMALIVRAKVRPSLRERWRHLGRTPPLLGYLGAVALLASSLTSGLLLMALADGLAGWVIGLVAGLALLVSSQPALALVNWLATRLATPHALPRMDFTQGMAPSARTLVVVPTLLTSLPGVEALVEALEVRFLANRDPCLHFGLLTDFADAGTEHLPGDAALLQRAESRIAALNRKYPDTGQAGFFLFHRPRCWNPQEGCWMGYERKRGKLSALNALLRGRAGAAFSRIVGDTAMLSEVRYVITLDTDTQLPRDAARLFAATLAHPLNQPHYDPLSQRVTAGYGILQPRMAVNLPSTNRSRYAHLCGSEAGIDPYTRAVSDVYQDLFDEGSFIGKGIYHVDAFEQALDQRFPENRILSHDLLEGCYARAGLVSDVMLYEDYPGRYSADVSRRYRWIRGDWQIAQWLWPTVPGPDGTRLANPLSLLSRWKLFDNLRRSLAPATLVGLFVLGWTSIPSYLGWTLALVGMLTLPVLASSSLDGLSRPRDVSLGQHGRAVLTRLGRQLAQVGLHLACLPHEALFSLDAIVRTLIRLGISHTRLLEWNPSGELQQAFERKAAHHPDPGGLGDLAHTCAKLWVGPLLALTLLLALGGYRPVALLAAWPVLALWAVGPLLVWWLSRPLSRPTPPLSAGQTRFLHALARKTWGFFETFVSRQENWLPPDNMQEHPVTLIAHRTSPTNIGLSLLANLAAYDFGYIAIGTLLTRTRHTLATLHRLERHRGHFYNWYDTQTLLPLMPLYVSSVDSGNLSGHLLTLRPGLLALADQPVLSARTFAGLGDTLTLLLDSAGDYRPAALAQLCHDIEWANDTAPNSLATMLYWLDALNVSAQAVAALALPDDSPCPNAEWPVWAQALQRQCQDALDELVFLLPWARLSGDNSGLEALPGWASLPTLRDLAALAAGDTQADPDPPRASFALNTRQTELAALVRLAGQRASERLASLAELAQQVGELARVEYDFLYDPARHLLAVGYHVESRRCDSGNYDLLASEARLSCFVAIAQGALPQESWFALGRTLTATDGETILLSWSGSMFEYLMPLLVMPSYDHTLLDHTCQAVVRRQIRYARQRGLPHWGISESGYNAVDTRLNYQYRAFGVPGLGLKRGLADDLVVAPYASMLALMVAPDAACQNLQRLAQSGMLGRYGMYEAVDYTASRLSRDQSSVVVRSFMVHHQGMGLLALAYLLLNRPMQRRFESDPCFQATTLLLQERIPAATASHFHAPDAEEVSPTLSGPEMPMRVFTRPDSPTPEVQLLSNGRYHVMVTHTGGGYSRWKDHAVTRWREDGTRDHWGAFCYLRDLASQHFWSTAHQPTLKEADRYQAIFSEGRVEFRRSDQGYDTHTEIVVSPEDDIELRRVRITNGALVRRTIEITSYAEVVLAPAMADALHPSFSNLFIDTEILADLQAIICTRRPRAQGEATLWMVHLMAVHGGEVGPASYETDRLRFIGRQRGLNDPQAMYGEAALSGSAGAVLDPIVAIRYGITLDPEQSTTIDVVTGVGDSREAVLALLGKYRDRHLADRVFDLAWTHSWVNLQQINASESDAQLYGQLAGSVIYANPALRADASVLARNQRGQSGLWGYAVSGDLPIVLLRIRDPANIELVRQLVQAHAYWRLKGLAVDLVIWNEDHAGYRQLLHEQIMGLIAAGVEANLTDRPGGIFVRVAEQMSGDDRILFQSVARVILSDSRGSLTEQIQRGSKDTRPPALPRLLSRPASTSPRIGAAAAVTPPAPALQFFNGLGGFSQDGREYRITRTHGHPTPAPWVNVLANAGFGTVVADSGAAYTWCDNAHECRLTPWSDDAVSDSSGETFYLRDEVTGAFWSPTPHPCAGRTPYVIRHGFGYSVFEHDEDGIRTDLTVYVDVDAAVKFSVLQVRNHSGRARQLSATGYVEWVLGDLRPKTAMHVLTELDPASGAICAHNPYSSDFADRVAFFDADGASLASQVSVTGDRREFIGRNGSLSQPAAMRHTRLSNRLGAGLDPCAAIQVPFELADGQAREIIFRLGVRLPAGHTLADALSPRQRAPDAAHHALAAVHDTWRTTLDSVQVDTPDPALNLLANGWLTYQTLSSRLWARSGYYQSGGAYGFRDQLQDGMALVHTRPELLREHLLRCAARQFAEGDVQHWWHPPSGRGVRSRCSDDFLWLVQATCRYVQVTGDHSVLDQEVPFLHGRPVHAGDDGYYDLPGQADTPASLYQHCMRAVLHGLRFGAHGLPLMGSGDWNDGMNLVGIHGQGESVWLGFFLYDTLQQFARLARSRHDPRFADRCLSEAARLQQNLERHGWDGQWYLRAFFDDGSPLGAQHNPECQIDSIAQSWAVLSGAGDPARARQAMAAVDARLVRRDLQLVQLLAPPFATSALNPGYIGGYGPGVRENGGQYTHAAVWASMAFAAQGDALRAWEVFRMINPLHHADSAQAIATYKVEPYVMAADVYASASHQGRGGWTWYTGSAGWMSVLIMESLLGVHVEAGYLRFTPCLPADWPGFTLRYRYQRSLYCIAVQQSLLPMQVIVDDVLQPDGQIALLDDGHTHAVSVRCPYASPVPRSPGQ